MYNQDQQKAFYDQSKHFLAHMPSHSDYETLKSVLVFHEWKYSVENSPVIADFEYDQLYKHLEQIEHQHPELISADSPTQRVSSDISADFKTVKHLTPMLSLGNSYDAADLFDFDKQIKKLTQKEGDIAYTVEPKFDGGSIALVYENDLLIRAATRGNGIEGDEMTPNARAMSSIPLRAEFSKYGIYKVELRGEALIEKNNFAKINVWRQEEGLSLFANPRNAATGGLRTKDASETRNRGLEAFIFQMGYAIDTDGNDKMGEFTSHYEVIETLGKLGFKIPHAEKKLCKNIETAAAFCAQWQEDRDSYPYEIDGMVVKLDDLALQEKCGFTQHHPRWAIAYKFKAKQATTTLIDIEYQIGKIGSITPVAKLDPVQLAGVTISSVSLHNEEFISTKDLRIGDKVLVERAGDVIPYIVKSFEELRDGSEKVVQFPTHCPSCDTSLVKEESEAAWRCINTHCHAQILQRLIFHVSKDAMNIDGFGKSYVERFYELGWIQNMSDIYDLDYEAIAQLEGFKEKSALNIQNAINKSKENPIHRLLHSLSIHHLGKKASKIIAEHIAHVLELQHWTIEQLQDIKDIGPVVAENVIAYFHDPMNIAQLHRMESLGVNLTQLDEDKPLQVAEDAVFSGQTILFTGTLYQMGRKEAQELAAKAGAKNISAVSSNLNILVAGEKAGSKLKKAEALGTVRIMTEQEFLDLVRS